MSVSICLALGRVVGFNKTIPSLHLVDADLAPLRVWGHSHTRYEVYFRRSDSEAVGGPSHCSGLSLILGKLPTSVRQTASTILYLPEPFQEALAHQALQVLTPSISRRYIARALGGLPACISQTGLVCHRRVVCEWRNPSSQNRSSFSLRGD